MRNCLAFFYLLVVAAVSARSAHAASGAVSNANGSAAAAFAHYVTQQQSVPPWSLESINIEASLPKLAKHGSLNAIRRTLPEGEAVYEHAEAAGDRTVTREVIARYLSADQWAAETPAAAVAMTPDNYTFSYQGLITSGGRVLYRFRVTPRKKRLGLLKGELWLDDAGIAVRQSGSFVKQPSILIKRMQVTRVLSVEESRVQQRITHLSIETRIFGPAELVVIERPYTVTSAPGPPE